MADTRAPQLRRLSPSDNASNVSSTSNLVLTFNENVKAGTGQISIYKSDGTLFRTIAVTDSSQVTISGRAVTINPSVSLDAGTSYYVLVGNGAIKDIAGNSYGGISSSTAFNFTTAGTGGGNPPTDTTAPLLTGTSPSDNATGVDVSTNLILTFNEAVKAGAGNIQIRDASNGTLVQSIAITDAGKVTFSGNQIIIDPGADLLPDTGYYVQLGSGVVRDLANNAFAGIASSAVFNFTTESNYIDTTAPIVLFGTPIDVIHGAADIVIVFNEPVKAGTGAIEIRSVADDSLYRTISVSDTSQVSFLGRTLTIDPTTDLGSGEYYVVLVPGTITDLAGNDYDGVSSVAAFVQNAGVIATAIGVGATAIGATGYAASASAIASGTGFLVAFASTSVSAGATATAGTQVPMASGYDPGVMIAGNDVALDMTDWNYDAALNGILISATSTQIDILGTDGLTYRFFGFNFATGATTIADVGGTGIWLVEVWAGSGESAHIVHSHYADFRTLNDIETIGLPDIDANARIIGSSDDDILVGTPGTDAIFGREGDDVLRGNQGDDLLSGGPGIDEIHGGAGEDVFAFISLEHLDGDTIKDLESGDKIDLSAIGGLLFIGSSAFSGVAGQVRYTWGGGNTTLQIDSDGNGSADASLLLSGAQFSLGETTPGSHVLVLTGITPLSGLVLTGNNLSNTIVGGAGDDVITGLGRNDTLTGAGGADKFVYNAVSDSTSDKYDTITDFNASADLIDLWFQVTGVDTSITSGSLATRRFDSDLAAAIDAGNLAPHHAVLFAPNAGTLSGKTFLIIDANGTAGYQASADLVILLGNASSPGGLTTADFV